LNEIRKNETEDTFIFLQQALNKVYTEAVNYQYVNATIWLTKGNHFYFSCLDFISDDSAEGDPLNHDAYCQLQSMKIAYPKTDNIDLKVRALRCDSVEAQLLPKSKEDQRWFYEQCIYYSSSADERPVVYVNSNNFYFNITKSATFEDIIFDGIN
jgi:hypothetical protein